MNINGKRNVVGWSILSGLSIVCLCIAIGMLAECKHSGITRAIWLTITPIKANVPYNSRGRAREREIAHQFCLRLLKRHEHLLHL